MKIEVVLTDQPPERIDVGHVGSHQQRGTREWNPTGKAQFAERCTDECMGYVLQLRASVWKAGEPAQTSGCPVMSRYAS